MLVLSRKAGEDLIIDGQIVVRVVHVRGNRVRLGIQAPPDVRIRRSDSTSSAETPDPKPQPPLCPSSRCAD
jgi:carbon storage regulator